MPGFNLIDSGLATYNFVQIQFQPATNASDVIMIGGFGGQTKFRYIEVSGTGTAAQRVANMIRRSTKSTGGASTNPVPSKADSSDQPSQNQVTLWTANPGALGTTVATVDGSTFTMVASTAIQDRAIFQYEYQTSKPITLNGGTADFLCINMATAIAAAQTASTDRIDFDVWWTER